VGPSTVTETNDRSRIGFHFCNIFFVGHDRDIIDRNTIADFTPTSQITHCTTFSLFSNSVFKKVATLSLWVLFVFMNFPIIVVIILWRQGLFCPIYYRTKNPIPLIKRRRIAFWVY
jgi:hypothetical protein